MKLPKSEIASPGFQRMRANMGEEAYEKLRADTIRQQEAALAGVRNPPPSVVRKRKPRRDDEYPLPKKKK